VLLVTLQGPNVAQHYQLRPQRPPNPVYIGRGSRSMGPAGQHATSTPLSACSLSWLPLSCSSHCFTNQHHYRSNYFISQSSDQFALAVITVQSLRAVLLSANSISTLMCAHPVPQHVITRANCATNRSTPCWAGKCGSVSLCT
jgi:hypothetical protein